MRELPAPSRLAPRGQRAVERARLHGPRLPLHGMEGGVRALVAATAPAAGRDGPHATRAPRMGAEGHRGQLA
jgi:hypothetical protein